MKAQGDKTTVCWGRFAAAIMCLALSFALGVSQLKSHPLVLEEWDSVKHLAATQAGPTNSIVETIKSTIEKTGDSNHAPGYYVLLNVWGRLAGINLASLRLLSVFTSLLALALTYRLARLAGGRETALDAALLATFTAFTAYYSYTARMYSLLALLSVWVAWSYWRVAHADGSVARSRWLAFIFSAAAIMWTHYLGTIVLLAVGFYHVFFAPKQRRWLEVSFAAGGAALLFAPWLPIFVAGLLIGGAPGSADLALTPVEGVMAIASIYSNGLAIVAPVVGLVAVANFRRLSQPQKFIFIVLSAMLLFLLIGNEFVPLLIARRIRYTIILALPWACALAIGLNRLSYWRYLRIPCLILWIAAFAAYSRSESMLRYTNWLNLNLHKSPHYQDLLYEPAIDLEMSDYVVSFHADSAVNSAVLRYYDEFLARWSGVKHLWISGDGSPVVQSWRQTHGSIEGVAGWSFRAWVVYNPEQTDLPSLSAYTDVFRQHFKPCGRYVEKRETVIALYGPKNTPCDLLTSGDTPGIRVEYDSGSVLGNISYELDRDSLSVRLWWAETESSVYAYSLQVFDQDGAKVGPQTDTVISDRVIYEERLELSSLPAGEYVLKLVVYDFQTLESQPGLLAESGERFERDFQIGRIALDD